MPDHDVGALSLATPPAAAPVTTYRPAVRVKNFGIHPANVSGFCRMYRREPPGDLLATWSLVLQGLAAGDEGNAVADGYWTPVEADIDHEFLFTAEVTTDHDQRPQNNNLAPVTVLVTAGEPPPEPIVTDHATQHENGGTDEIHLDGLSGECADEQPPKDHAGKHAQGGADQLNVNGLPGKLADQQTPEPHHARHELGGDDEITALAEHHERHESGGADELSIADLAGNPAARGQADGLASLGGAGLVPDAQLATNGPSELSFLSAGREWQAVPVADHHTTHEPGGSDPVSGVPPSAHHTTHEPGGDDEILGLGFAPHASHHESGGDDVISIAGLSGESADPQVPKSHSATHELAGADEMTIAGLQGNPATRGAANGLASLDATSKVPTVELGGAGATNDKFLRGDRTWAEPATLPHGSSHTPGGDDKVDFPLAVASRAETITNAYNNISQLNNVGRLRFVRTILRTASFRVLSLFEISAPPASASSLHLQATFEQTPTTVTLDVVADIPTTPETSHILIDATLLLSTYTNPSILTAICYALASVKPASSAGYINTALAYPETELDNSTGAPEDIYLRIYARYEGAACTCIARGTHIVYLGEGPRLI